MTFSPDGPEHHEDRWQVYLVECADGTFYCGVTNDVQRRIEQHNGLRRGGAKYTRIRRPVRLLATLKCVDKQTAFRTEYAVKKLPRVRKLAFFTDRNNIEAEYGHHCCKTTETLT